MIEFFILINAACLCHIISTQSDVRLPPTLTRWPQIKNISYSNGSQFTLQCAAEGTPAVRYEWKKNGFELNTNLSNIRKGSDGTMTIKRATEMDEGYYQCLAKNQYGTALSNMVDVRMKFSEPTARPSTVLQKTVVEGMPFHIEADRQRSSHVPVYDWYTAADINARYYARLRTSERIQIAGNGDLHFAYALPTDGSGGKIYRCTTYYRYSDIQTKTQLTVTNSTGNISQTVPTLAFSSEAQTVVSVGGSVVLRCFFYGFPVPVITWRGPTRTLPTGRHSLFDFDTTLNLYEVAASDAGNYSCTASNAKGSDTLTLQIFVGRVEPNYNSTKDGPYNVNVTEGESITFSCNAFAKPEANIVWLRNGHPIDTDNPPERYGFSNDLKSLTIRDVCRDCVDRESQTDLTVIQCNASNAFGYAFASGYLNVLLKTKVTIISSINVSVDVLEKKQFVSQCNVTFDPSTPPTVRWYKVEPFGDLVRDEPPYVYVTNEFLILTIDSNCSTDCAKYLGEYRCIGDNGYSRDRSSITLPYKYEPSPGDHTTEDITKNVFREDITKNVFREDIPGNKETWAVWMIIVIVAVIGLVLLLIGIFLALRWKRRFDDDKRQTIEGRTPNPVSICEDVGYDSIGHPLEEIVGSNERPMKRDSGEYEHIGYDSIDKVLDEIGKREDAMSHSLDAHENNRYESLDVPEREAIGRGSASLEKDTYDNMGYSMPLEEVTNDGGKDQPEINGYESVQSETENVPKANEQSEASNTKSDLNREEDKNNLDLKPKEVNSRSDVVSKIVNQYLDLVSNEVNSYLDLSPTELNQYLDLDPKEVNQYLDLDPKEVNQCLDLNPKEVNQYLDLDSKEVNQYLDLDSKEVNQYLDLKPKELNQYLDLDPKEVNPSLGLGPKEVNPSLGLGPKEVNPSLGLGLKEVNPYLDLGSKEMDPSLYIGPKEVNP